MAIASLKPMKACCDKANEIAQCSGSERRDVRGGRERHSNRVVRRGVESPDFVGDGMGGGRGDGKRKSGWG